MNVHQKERQWNTPKRKAMNVHQKKANEYTPKGKAMNIQWKGNEYTVERH